MQPASVHVAQQTFPPPQRRLFQAVLDALTAGRVEFAVAGAFAFQRYTGIHRFTKDLDLFLPASEMGRALGLCRRVGLEVELVDAVWLAKARSGDYFVDLIAGMSNGVLWVTPRWIARSLWDDILDRRVRVLGPEEMILSKVFVTRRERFDGSDICHLLYHCGPRLDWERLLSGIGEHREMLYWHLVLFRYVYPEAADCVSAAVWKRLARRSPRARGFRGTLVDPVMFAADVDSEGLENQEAAYRSRRLAS